MTVPSTVVKGDAGTQCPTRQAVTGLTNPRAANGPVNTFGVMPTAAWRACLVLAPAELSVVRTAWRQSPAAAREEWP